MPARTRWLLQHQKVPTGQTESTDKFFPGGKGALKDYNLDDVFSDLVRDAQGRATYTVKGRKQQLDITQGPNYRSLVIYSPNPLNTGLGSQIPPPNPNAPAASACAAPRGDGASSGKSARDTELHLLRADGGHHERVESRTQRRLQRASVHQARRHLAGKLLDQAVWILGGDVQMQGLGIRDWGLGWARVSRWLR